MTGDLVYTYPVNFLDGNGRLYVRTVLVPMDQKGLPEVMKDRHRTPTPMEMHLDRELRKVARMLQRDLQETFTLVSSQGLQSRPRDRIHKLILRAKPRVPRRSKGLWGTLHFGDFLFRHREAMLLLQASAVMGRAQWSRELHLKDVYWEVPGLKPGQKRSRA